MSGGGHEGPPRVGSGWWQVREAGHRVRWSIPGPGEGSPWSGG
jgi:hypothetical protein